MVLLNATHAAELLGVSKPTFYKMVEAGEAPELKPIQSTGSPMWDLDRLQKYLDERDQAEQVRRLELLRGWLGSVIPMPEQPEG